MRALWALVCLAGCANQFEADYEPTGTWSYAEMRGTPDGCAEGFVSALEEDVTLTGSFPEFNTADTTEGSITLLGETVALVIEAATPTDTARGVPPEETPMFDFEGTAWTVDQVFYDTKHSCADCKDEIVVRLDSSVDCYPWPVYQP